MIFFNRRFFNFTKVEKIMKLIPLIVLSLFLINPVSAQQLQFDFDYAEFGYDSLANYLEFYYSFNQATLTLVNADTTDFVKGILTIAIQDSATGDTVVNKNWMISNYINVRDSANINRSLRGVVGFVIDEGVYKCDIIGEDGARPGNMKKISEYIRVKPFLSHSTSLSDIQFASNIVPSSENKSSIFYKNTYEVTPVPTAIFGEGQPVLFYYLELYNLKGKTKEGDLTLDQVVVNSRGQIVHKESKSINKSADSRVEVGKVMVYKYPTDTYTLMLYLIDSVANYGVSSTKRFFVYNPSIVPVDTFQQSTSPVISTMFGAMSDEELDDLYAKSKYLASEYEKDQYEALTNTDGKREFLFKFWNARDDNPSDEVNNFFTSYMKRIEEANVQFSSRNKDGWKTDRGRVYLLYGEPSERERHPSEIETKPYEVWYYNDLEGGVQFVFADMTGFSDYQLVHSTKRGELRDDNWARRIMVQ